MINFTSIFGENDSIFYFGYHKGDDFFSMQYDLLKSSDYLLKILGMKNIKFSFPLRFSSKEQIIRKLTDIGMLDLYHWCEDPRSSENMSGKCNNCTPCKLYNDTVELIKLHNKNNYIIPELQFEYEYDSELFPLKVETKTIESANMDINVSEY